MTISIKKPQTLILKVGSPFLKNCSVALALFFGLLANEASWATSCARVYARQAEVSCTSSKHKTSQPFVKVLILALSKPNEVDVYICMHYNHIPISSTSKC